MNKKLSQNNLILFTILLYALIWSILHSYTPTFCSEYNDVNNMPLTANQTNYDNSNSEIKIQIDNAPISFKTSPEIINGTIMVPMSEFFETMGAYVIWVEKQRIAVAYKDNMHLKLLIDKNEAYQNGHRINLPQNFIVKDNHILIPIQIISNTFNMNPNWSLNDNTLYLNTDSDSPNINIFKGDIYKTVTIKDLNLAISMPYNWSKLTEQFSYGYSDEIESYSLIISSKDNNVSNNNSSNNQSTSPIQETSNIIDDDIYFSLEELYKNRINIIKDDNYTISNSIKVRKIVFETFIDDSTPSEIKPFILLEAPIIPEDSILPENTNSKQNIQPTPNLEINQEITSDTELTNTTQIEKIKQTNILYIINSDKKTYFIICSQGEKVNTNTAEQTFDNIISTFIIRNESIDTNKEHYVEFEAFYNYGFNLSKQYHSNMIIDNSKLNFSGNIFPNSNISYLKVNVNRNNENISFHLPINNNSFNDTIHLPFALGQHNLMIYAITSENTEIPIMQFSIINIDRNSTRYIIPTSKIQSDDPKIKSITQTITYKHNTKYKSSYAIFHWITNNLVIDKNSDNNINTSSSTVETKNKKDVLSNYKIFENTKGSMEEINQLLVAMFRSIKIPSRVVYGKNTRNHSYYWTELNLNGSWVAADPISNINYLNNDFLSPSNLKFTPIEHFRQSFTNINIQNY